MRKPKKRRAIGKRQSSETQRQKVANEIVVLKEVVKVLLQIKEQLQT